MPYRNLQTEEAEMLSRALRVVDAWAISEEQACALLGGLSVEQLHDLRRPRSAAPIDLLQVSDDLLVRATLINSIDESLHILFPVADRANGWIKRPNDGPGFGGRPALALMLESVDQLDYVCRYLKGWTVS